MRRNFWLKTIKSKNNFEDLDIYGSIILKWILGGIGGCELDSFGSG